MEDTSFKTVLAKPEETEEPYRKKFKSDSNQVIFEKGEEQLFEMCSEDKKSANKFLCFPKILWNFSQHNLELREKSNTNLKTSVIKHANFKMYMNANLQSRLLENIPYIEKWSPNSCIRNGSCKFKRNNSDSIKLESLVSYAKESETATKTANMSKANEWPTRDIFFYNILAEKYIARIESLFGDVPEFQNKEKDPGCCHVCKMLQSEEQPVRSDENRDEVSKFCLPFKYFMNGKKSDFESLTYEYKNILQKNSNILSYKKQKRFSGKNFRRNKIFRRTHTLYLKKCGINLKLTKSIAFELFLQSKGIYSFNTVAENSIPVLNHISQINHQQTEKSNEDTKEWFLCSIDIREDNMLCYGKKQTSQIILSNNQNIQSRKFNIILWERIFLKQFLYILETIYNLADNFRLLNYLILSRNMLKKSKAKHFKLGIVTVEPFIQKKNRKTCNQTSGFSCKKLKHSYFVLRVHNRWEKRIFRNSISCTNNKHVSKYIVTDSKERMNKMQHNNHKHNQNNPCDFVDRKSHFDTHKKISLSSYLEEIEHISVLGEVIITDEKYSKRCITADKGFTRSHSKTLTYICAPPKLCASDSCFLKQSKSKTSQYFKDRKWLKHKLNDKFYPTSKRLFKHSLRVNHYFSPNMFHNFCLTQNMAISVETRQNKTSLYGKKAKPRSFGFEKIKCVLQYQYQTRWISNVFKAPKAKAIENMNFLDSNNILFSGTIMSEIICINRTAEDVNKTKCPIAEKNYVNKRNHSQNLGELHFKEECAKSVNSVDKLTASCSIKQKGFEDSREEQFSSETNRRNQFELVLKELHMFNEISKENESNLSQTEINIPQKESHVLNCSDNIPDQVNRNTNQIISTTDITMNCTSVVKQTSYKKNSFKQNIKFGEEEIPHNYSSNLSDEELLCSSSEKRGHYKQSFSWKPAFVSQTFMKERSYNLTTEKGNCLLSGIIRIQPLKTCCGPLRVGLSRKAKLKQLHPYLK